MRSVLLLAGVTLLSACAATVTCPPVDGESRPVYLLDHGRHASLVLVIDDTTAHRYSYGDRRWYAEGDTGIGPGFNALFRRTPAVLMRRQLRTGPTLDEVIDAVRTGVENAYAFAAPAARVDALATELDALHAAGAGDPGPEYAAHPVPYTAGYNSNHVVADWLRELGCYVRGSPMVSRWNAR